MMLTGHNAHPIREDVKQKYFSTPLCQTSVGACVQAPFLRGEDFGFNAWRATEYARDPDRSCWSALSGFMQWSRHHSTESEQGRAGKPRARIESLADLIFGLALSVGAISLVSNPPMDVQAIYNDLATFGFSFLILITMWLRYTRIMSVFPIETRRVNNLNILLLFCSRWSRSSSTSSGTRRR